MSCADDPDERFDERNEFGTRDAVVAGRIERIDRLAPRLRIEPAQSALRAVDDAKARPRNGESGPCPLVAANRAFGQFERSLFGRLHRFDGALKAEIGGLGEGWIRGFAVAQQSEHLLNV